MPAAALAVRLAPLAVRPALRMASVESGACARRRSVPHRSRIPFLSDIGLSTAKWDDALCGPGPRDWEGEGDGMSKLTDALRQVPPQAALQIAFSHALLLAGAIWGGLPYVVLQAMLAGELLLINIATIPLYPQRSIARHLGDVIKMAAVLAFILFFVVISYGVARSATHEGEPLRLALRAYEGLGPADFGWALAYLLARLTASMWQAKQSRDPRGMWARQNLLFGGSTFVAMLFMVFGAFFVGNPLIAGLARIGVVADADVLLSSLMVFARCFTALVAATMSASEIDAIASDPYPD
jgi:hypothetical protein